MPRPRNTDARRAQIAEGLLAAMSTAGYAETTIADIATRAGLTAGLIHYHFKSKRAVLLFAVERLAETALQRYAERTSPERALDARARLLAFIDAYVGLGKDADPRAVACWVAIAAEAVRDDDVRAVYHAACERAFAELLQLTRAALPAHDADRARPLAATLWCAIQGSYQVATASPGIVPRGSMTSSLERVVDDALGRAHHAPSKKRRSR